MALFSEFEIIMYLSDNLAQKEHIENGINRKLTIVNNLDTFIEVLEESREKYGKVNIVIPKDMSKAFRANLNDVVAAINTITSSLDAMVFSIGLGDIFDNAYTFGTVTSFIDYARKHDRHQRITELEESEDEKDRHGAVLLKQLMLENEALEEREVSYLATIEQNKKDIEEMQSELDKMKLEIDTVYKIQLDNNEHETQQLENKIKDLERQLLIEAKKMEDYQNESNEFRNLNKTLELDKKSLEEHVEDLRNEIRLLNRQIAALKKDAENNEKLHAELYKSHVDSEKYAILKAELDKVLNEKRSVEEELIKANIQNKKQGYKLNEIIEENRNLRQGDVELVSSGRTTRLDSTTFNSVNVFYIKVIQELPYLNSHIKEFARQIDNYFSGNTTTCIINYDEGLDNHLFESIDVYSNIGSVPQNTDIFLLYPSQRMMTDAEDFEAKYNNLIVVDYIKSNDYYVSTNAMYRIFTTVRYSTQLRKFGLRGLPISLDGTSVLNIEHDVRMVTATTAKVRNKMIEGKVTNWLEKSTIIQ